MNNNYGKTKENKCNLGIWEEGISIVKEEYLGVSFGHQTSF
jgi:hypothetical protein